jgi:nitrite reductase/ring-hydroxylating ferredoxin subunit
MASDQGKNQRNRPYGGYFNRPKPAAEVPFSETSPGTGGGEYLRRYWHPFMLASELADLPKALRLLGEDLVIFRDKSGQLGLLHRQCIHRGASLEFGIPQERGIMCCYHGWHFDVDGTVIATPAEPQTSQIRDNFCQGAYAVREEYGMFFAYMGPPDLEPEFPIYDTFTYPNDTKLVPYKVELPCNWVQVVENAADPIHNAYLHAISSGPQFAPAFAVLPALDFVETPLGFLSMATRRIKDNVFIRSSDIILPNVAQFTSGASNGDKEGFQLSSQSTRWVTPVDDHNCFYIGLAHFSDAASGNRPRQEDQFGLNKMALIGQTADRPYHERQREPGDYDAVTSQGSVANRANEHLGLTDRGIVLFRRLLTRAIKAVQQNEVPPVPRLYSKGSVRTYTHAFVFRIPSQSNIESLASLEMFGRRAAEIVIDTDQLEPAEREKVAYERIVHLLSHDLVN